MVITFLIALVIVVLILQLVILNEVRKPKDLVQVTDKEIGGILKGTPYAEDGALFYTNRSIPEEKEES